MSLYISLIFYTLTSTNQLTLASPNDLIRHHKSTAQSARGASPLCRDRMGYFRRDDFRVSTCTMCFVYLFPTFPNFRQFVTNGTAVLVKTSSGEVEVQPIHKSFDPSLNTTNRVQSDPTRKVIDDDAEPIVRLDRNLKQKEHRVEENKTPQIVILRPDVQKKESMEDICLSLTSSQCHRWQQCCRAASQCCDRQIKLAKTPKTPATDRRHGAQSDDPDTIDDVTTCPITWDGYSCVQETAAGKTAHVTCPSFISLYTLSSSASATRRCSTNATWWKSPISHLEWTDYSQCIPVDFESMKVAQILAIACNCVSIACVIPSLIVFIVIRPLRRQPRIQLHISMFVAMLVAAIFGLLWERLVMYDMLVTPLLHNFVHSHPGFHLQWLMVRSFKPFHALGVLSLIGWGIPTLLIITYITVRYFHFDDDPCWIQSAGVFEWVIDGPTMACIALNLVFLAIILRALWSQLEAHPDHIGPVRRTVRALFLLIPLFGLQQFCIIYRPHVTDTNYVVYDVISAIIVNSQGALVAIIFCFLNDEVQTQVRQHVSRWIAKVKAPHQSRQGDPVSATHVPMATTHRPSLISTVLPTE